MSALKVLLHKLGAVFFWLLSLCRRVICFGRRKNKSYDNSLESLEEVTTCHYTGTSVQTLENETELESWDSWKDPDMTSAERHNGIPSAANTHKWRQKQEPELEPEINFFEDMVPQVKRTPTVIIKKKPSDWSSVLQSASQSSRLNIDNFVVPSVNSELGTWEDDGTWEDEMNNTGEWDTDLVLREKKRFEREKRLAEHERRKQERDGQRTSKTQPGLGVKYK